MAEARAHPGQQQHEAWGVDGPSVNERLEYLDLFAGERVEGTRGQSEGVWRSGVVMDKQIDREGRLEVKVHFKGMPPGYCRWILWGAEGHQFVAQGTHTGNRQGASVNVSGGGRADDGASGSSSKRGWAKRAFIGAVKGLIRSQQDAVSGTVVQRSQTPTSVGDSRVPTPTSATSNAGTPASVSSSVSRAAAGGGSDSEGAFFIEEEKGRGISPASSTTSASRQLAMKGKLQGFIRGQQGANPTQRPAANIGAGAPASTAGMYPNPNPFHPEEGSPDREELKEDEAFLKELGFENEEGVEMKKEEKGGPMKPQVLEAKKEVIRELTPHMMEELSPAVGGGYQLTVFRKNKQDEFATSIAVGVFETEIEAKRAAECYSSPVWHEPQPDSRCEDCGLTFSSVRGRRKHHCRNCGRLVCTHCASMFWPENMLPQSYRRDSTERRVRICNKCFNVGHDFRSALLSGSEEEAMTAYKTGCVNPRVPYIIYQNELPVHCAAAGGNVSLLSWLMEDLFCPVFSNKSKTVALGDRNRRNVMAAAVHSGKLEVMRYLAFTQPSIFDSLNDRKTLWRGLDTCLRYDEESSEKDHRSVSGNCYTIDYRDSWDKFEFNSDTTSDSVPMEEAYSMYDLPGGHRSEDAAVVGGGKNACIKCFIRKVDCTLVPCGHHCCCLVCAGKFDVCPVCFKPVQDRIKAIDV